MLLAILCGVKFAYRGPICRSFDRRALDTKKKYLYTPGKSLDQAGEAYVSDITFACLIKILEAINRIKP